MNMEDIFSDRVQVSVNQLGASLTFLRTEPPNQDGSVLPPIPVVRIRLSPAMLKLVTMTIRRAIKLHEGAVGTVQLDPAFLNEIGTSLEDW
mgnify:CR=1 FL=1